MTGWETTGALGLPWLALGWMLGIALLVAALGFYRMVYFVSVGYAFSIVGMALALLSVQRGQVGALALVQVALLLIWGLRLGIFLLRREWQSSYRAQAQAVHGASAQLGVGVRALIWVSVALLYVALFAPGLFAALGGAGEGAARAAPAVRGWQWGGLAIMLLGLMIEAVADWQKSAAKARQPDRYCSTGLYAWVRAPNYLGEMLFWVGNFGAAIGFYAGWAHWLLALVGVVCLVLIMLGAAKRLEAAQAARYGVRPDYQAYARTTPVLLPFVPLYSLRNLRVYLG